MITAGHRAAEAPRTTTTTSAPTAAGRIRIFAVGASSLTADGNGYALKDTTLTGSGRIHPIIDGEIPADQVRPHCRILTGQCFGLICRIGLVLSVVDTCNAGIATS